MLILLFLAVEHKVNMQVLEQSELIMNTMAMATERYLHPVSVLFVFFSPPYLCSKYSSIVVVMVDSGIWVSDMGLSLHCILRWDTALLNVPLHPPRMGTGDILLVVASSALCILSSSDGLAFNTVTTLSVASCHTNQDKLKQCWVSLCEIITEQHFSFCFMKVCLIPVSAHGTNPASAQMAGYQVQVIKVESNGYVSLTDLSRQVC